MSGERVRRAERIVDLRKRDVELAQAVCAKATMAAQEAEQAARDAEQAWMSAGETTSDGSCASSTDLAESSAWLRTLKLRADRAAARSREARKEVEQAHASLVAARSELRRIELWRDGLASAERAVTDRKERIASDEVAARTARRER